MHHPNSFTRHIARSKARAARGFTLIEVMIVVAVIAILASIAIPSYRDYILRGQLVDATNLLSATRANMERYFQDNRTYAAFTVGANNFAPPCASSPAVGKFTVTCTGADTPTGTRYVLTANGTGSVANFSYTVDQDGVPATVSLGAGWTVPTPNSCWVLKKGQTC